MPRGGARPGAGRKKGQPNKRTAAARKATEDAIQKAVESGAIPQAFEGDAHAFMALVYKDTSLDLAVRLEAAKAAAPYEKPRLASLEQKIDGDLRQRVISDEPMSSDDWERTYSGAGGDLAAAAGTTKGTH